MMEVQGVVLERGIVVFGLLRNLLFDVFVNCGVGVFGSHAEVVRKDHSHGCDVIC